MEEYKEQLIARLLQKNNQVTYDQALTWVELLWEDFEATYAKAGHEYKGAEMTLKVVTQWIDNYGEQLHNFVAKNPKYRHLFEGKGNSH